MSKPLIEIVENKEGIFLVRGAFKMCKCSHISDARYLKIAIECLERERKKSSQKFGGVFDSDKM